VPSIIVTFKREDSVEGEPIGPVYISDEDHPEAWVGHPYDRDGAVGSWMRLSEVREWAAARGYKFGEA